MLGAIGLARARKRPAARGRWRLALGLVLLPVLVTVRAVGAAEAVPSLCGADERVLFSCRLTPGGRVASLCGTKVLTAERGALAYRFGRPGRIELVFPETARDSQRRFAYAHYVRPRLDTTEVSFVNRGYRYTLFDRFDGESGKPKRERGVRVGRVASEAELRLTCHGPTIARLTSLEDIVPCDVNNPLNLNACPAR